MNIRNAENRYKELSTDALTTTQQELTQFMPELEGHISLTDITENALLHQERWEIAENRQIGWDWRVVRNNFRINHAARIELAIWYDNELCGLMLGKASDGKLVFKINYLQGGEEGHPLENSILPIASRCAELFAASIHADWIAIQDPIDREGLINYYREQGFTEDDPFDPRNNALFKRVVVNE